MTVQELTSKAGKARQASMTPAERTKLASLAGQARAKSMTPEQRKSFSQKGVEARRAKKQSPKN